MIEGFVRWLRDEPEVALNGPALAAHIEGHRLLVLSPQESHDIGSCDELWKDTLIADGTTLVAQRSPDEAGYVVHAMIDVAQSQQGAALYDKLGYVPCHLALQWYSTDANGGSLAITPYGGAIGAAGIVESYDTVRAVPVVIDSRRPVDRSTHESLSGARWIFGQQLFSSLTAMQNRRLIVCAPIPHMRNGFAVQTVMERNYGLH